MSDFIRETGDSDDVDELVGRVRSLEDSLGSYEIERMLSGENDDNNAIIFINSGAGGTEAQDWAEMLFRMYLKWAEKKGFETQVVDMLPGEEAGLKNVTFIVSGKHAYGYLKCENGIHRLVRVSPYDANNRRHTSFASVYAYPEISEDIEVEVKEEDLRIDTYRSSGAGGQYVNMTDSAVRITHVPTGIVVTCQDERSQLKNRVKAMAYLRAKLYDAELRKQNEELASERRGQIGTGDRSERIRTYNFSQNRITDHRIGVTLYKLDQYLDGDLYDLIEAMTVADQTERLHTIEAN